MANPVEAALSGIKNKTAEVYIGEADLDLFKKAGASSPKELAWIAEVKLASDTSRGQRRRYDKEDGGIYMAGRASLDAYQIVRLKAMEQRDFKTLGSRAYNRDTLRQIERYFSLILKICQYVESKPNPGAGEPIGFREMLKRAKHANEPHEQAEIITEFITLVHGGGSPWGLEYFGGFPGSSNSAYFDEVVAAANRFFDRLNNLGHQDYKY